MHARTARAPHPRTSVSSRIANAGAIKAASKRSSTATPSSNPVTTVRKMVGLVQNSSTATHTSAAEGMLSFGR